MHHISRRITAFAFTALLILTLSCTDSPSHEVSAPVTAQCVMDKYYQYASRDTESSRTFAAVKCTNDAEVVQEISQLQHDPNEDATACQERHQQLVPEDMPYRLAKLYAAIICIP